jgi:hypothetical protein
MNHMEIFLTQHLLFNCLLSRLMYIQVFVFYCFKHGTRDYIFFDFSVYVYFSFTLRLLRHVLFTKLSATNFPHDSNVVCKLLQIIPFMQHSTIQTALTSFPMNRDRHECPYHVAMYDKVKQS